MDAAEMPLQSDKVKICVLGGGSFGTAMATCAARNGHTVSLYVRDPVQAESINTEHRNPRYLKEFEVGVGWLCFVLF